MSETGWSCAELGFASHVGIDLRPGEHEAGMYDEVSAPFDNSGAAVTR